MILELKPNKNEKIVLNLGIELSVLLDTREASSQQLDIIIETFSKKFGEAFILREKTNEIVDGEKLSHLIFSLFADTEVEYDKNYLILNDLIDNFYNTYNINLSPRLNVYINAKSFDNLPDNYLGYGIMLFSDKFNKKKIADQWSHDLIINKDFAKNKNEQISVLNKTMKNANIYEQFNVNISHRFEIVNNFNFLIYLVDKTLSFETETFMNIVFYDGYMTLKNRKKTSKSILISKNISKATVVDLRTICNKSFRHWIERCFGKNTTFNNELINLSNFLKRSEIFHQ